MRGAFLLLIHSLKRVRTLVLTTGILLAGFQIILILVAKSIQLSGGFSQLSAMLPSFARDLFGPSMTSFMSFGGFVSLGYFDLAVIVSLVALAISMATTPTSEIETGFIDLVLSRPLARHWIITRMIVVMVLSIGTLLALMLLGTWIGLETLAPDGAEWPNKRLIFSLAVNLGLLLLCWSGVAMAIGSASGRRVVAGSITGLLALTAYLLDYVARMWHPAESLAWLSPFRYYNPFDLLMGQPLPMRNVLLLAGIAVTGFAAAYILFSRRDISH